MHTQSFFYQTPLNYAEHFVGGSKRTGLVDLNSYIDNVLQLIDLAHGETEGDLAKLGYLNQALFLCENLPTGIDPFELLFSKMKIFEERRDVFLDLGREEDALRDHLSFLFAMFFGCYEAFEEEAPEFVKMQIAHPELDLRLGSSFLALGNLKEGSDFLQKGAAKGCIFSALLLKAQGIDPSLILSQVPAYANISVSGELEKNLQQIFAEHRYGDALAEIDFYLGQNPSSEGAEGARDCRVIVLAVLGRWEEALAGIENSDALTTSSSVSGNVIQAVILAKLGRREEALIEIEKFRRSGIQGVVYQRLIQLLV